MRRAFLIMLLLLAPAMGADWLNANITFSFQNGYEFLHNDTLAVTATIILGDNVTNITDYSVYMFTSDDAFTINGTYNGVQNDIYYNRTNGTSFTTSAYTLKAEDNATAVHLNMDEEFCVELYDQGGNWTMNCTAIGTPALNSVQMNAVWDPPLDLKVYAVGLTDTSENTTFLNTTVYITYDDATCAMATISHPDEYVEFNETSLAGCPSEYLMIYTNSTTPGYTKQRNENLYMMRNLTVNATLYILELFDYERVHHEVERIIGNSTMRIKGYVLYDNGKALGASPDDSTAEVWLEGDDFASKVSTVNTGTGYFQFDFEMPENESTYTVTVNASGVHGLEGTTTWEVEVNNTKHYVTSDADTEDVRSKLSFDLDTSDSPLVLVETWDETILGNVTLNCSNQTTCTDCVNESCANCTTAEICVNVSADSTIITHSSVTVHTSESNATSVTLTVHNLNKFDVFGKATIHSDNEELFIITPSIRDGVPDNEIANHTFSIQAKEYAKPGRYNATIMFETFYGNVEQEASIVIDEDPWPAHKVTVRRYIDYSDNATVYLKVKNTKTIPVTVKITEDIPKTIMPTLEGYYNTTEVTDANNVTTNVTTVNENMTQYQFSEFPHILDYDPRVQWTTDLVPGGEDEVWYSANISVTQDMFSEPETFVDTHGLTEYIPDPDPEPEPVVNETEPPVTVPTTNETVTPPPPTEPEDDYTLILALIFGLLTMSTVTIVAGVLYWKKDKEIILFAKKLKYNISGFIGDLKAGRLKAPSQKKKKDAQPEKKEEAPVKEAPKEEAPKKDDKKGLIETATGFQEADSLDTIGEQSKDR